MIVERIQDTYFLIIGLGESGTAMSKFLRSRGETVVATDIDPSRARVAEELNALGIQTQIGFHDQETFNHARAMIPSPGVPLTNPYIKAAAASGVDITGELDIFARYNTLPVIAITGTNGKTTTTTLIGEMMKHSGKTPFVGGNIGTPLVTHLMSGKTADLIVAEVSSFQLDLSNRFNPDIGVLLNISEDHLDRYMDYTAYEASKWSLFKNQSAADTAVLNCSIKGVQTQSRKLASTIFTYSSEKEKWTDCSARIHSNDIKIQMKGCDDTVVTDQSGELAGVHNRENIAAATLACLAFGADITGIQNGLNTFKNLPHRMQFINAIKGISFYDDSKATNIDAVIRAIACFNNNIVLILGGREKGTDFSLLARSIKQHVKSIIAIGENRSHIKDTFNHICRVLAVETMKEAVQKAFESAVKDDIVLLSPACASFDMYDNYASRGNDFTTHVTALKETIE